MPKSDFKKKKRRNFRSNRTSGGAKSKYFDDYKEGLEDATRDKTNDPAWYAQYPELMRDSASIPYSIPTGTEISWDLHVPSTAPVPTTSSTLGFNAYQSVPGLMTIGIVPTPGVSTGATSPINVAMKMLYTKVRAENSGARNYDAPDLMLYCLAMDQVYSLITWYNRIYGKLMLYSQVNRYLPKVLLDHEYVQFDDLILHINDFKSFLDTATAQAAVFSVPADMKLFNRHAFMYQNIYKDAESAKAQLYQFSPSVFYTYDEYNGAGRLMPINILQAYPNGMKFTDLVDLFYDLMNPIIASEDFNIMSGDILKAFGEGNLIKLQIMPQGYTVFPITDYEVLTQIKNITMSNLTTTAMLLMQSNPADWSIHQDANVEFIEYNPVLMTGNTERAFYVGDRYLSTYKSTPEPSDNMVYTRLMWCAKEVDNSTSGTPQYDVYFDSVGSEFVSGVNVAQFHYDANGVWKTEATSLHTVSENPLSGISISNFLRVYLSKHFDFCPAIYLFYAATGGNQTYYFPIFDVDNWTIVHAYELEKMHRTALMSMLRVPMIGSALPSNMK